jgi:uncharacterized membrane protein (UPF0127 family)
MVGIHSWPKLRIGNYTLHVADTPQQKTKGLQLVDHLPENHLVLFKDTEQGVYFHTINCLFPIDIIPLNSENIVLDIWSVGINMKLIGPTPKETAFVIEAPAGWAKSVGLKIGSNFLKALV